MPPTGRFIWSATPMGGCVALRTAVERPDRIASLSLYEPVAFHVLSALGEEGRRLFGEVRAVALELGQHVMQGAYRLAAKLFYDYWNGAGAFSHAKPEVQAHVTRYTIKNAPRIWRHLRRGNTDRLDLSPAENSIAADERRGAVAADQIDRRQAGGGHAGARFQGRAGAGQWAPSLIPTTSSRTRSPVMCANTMRAAARPSPTAKRLSHRLRRYAVTRGCQQKTPPFRAGLSWLERASRSKSKGSIPAVWQVAGHGHRARLACLIDNPSD